MAHTETRGEAGASKARLFVSGLKSLAGMGIRHFRARWQTAATRRAISDLTRDQLNDIGYPEQPRPVIQVKAGLITNLTSMR
jgi:hypothetical protein